MTAMGTPNPDDLVGEFLARARPSSPDEYEAKVAAAQLCHPTPLALLPANDARTLAMFELDLQGWRPPSEDRTPLLIGEYAIFNIRLESGSRGETRVAQLCRVHDDGSLTLASDRCHFQTPKKEGGTIFRYSTFWADTVPADRIVQITSLPYAVRPGDLVFAENQSGEFLLAEKIGEVTPEGLVGFYKADDDPSSPGWDLPHEGDSGLVVRWEDIADLHIITRGGE